MAKTVCDFCLKESGGLFGKPTKLSDGHHICKECRSIIESYGLPVQFDLFQQLVTASPNLRDMIMDAYLETHKAEDVIAKHYPLPNILLHEGEHCLNAIPATITVLKSSVPENDTVDSIAAIKRDTINNIYDADTTDRKQVVKVNGMIYETEAAFYFISQKFINCHRLGYVKRNTGEKNRIQIVTKKFTYTYTVQHADLFFMRERFFRKVNAAANNKRQHLIYIRNDNELTITPGIYEIPRSLRPGIYKVKAIKDDGLHMRDAIGRVKDYYETEECIDLSEGGTLECTGEYELEWVGERKSEK